VWVNALDEMIGFWAAETGRRDVLQVPRAFVPLVGSADGAVFLAQLLAWGRAAPDGDGDGWVAASYAAWDAATALSRHRVQAVTRRCQALGIVEVRGARRGQGRRYRVLAAPLLRALAAQARREPDGAGVDQPAAARERGGRRRSARRKVRLPGKQEPAVWRAAPSRQPARQWDEKVGALPDGHAPARGPMQKNGKVGNLGNLGNVGQRGTNGSGALAVAAAPVAQAAPFDAACWAATQAELARKLPPPVYDRVVRDSVFAGVAGETVVVRAPSVNAAWWLNVRLTRPVARAVNLVAPGRGWLRVEAKGGLLFEGAADGAG
jgi:hypothetical protein